MLSINANISPSTANVNTGITWESSNESIATVNSKGLVTGISSGTCTITAKTGNNKSASYQITVYEKPLIEISSNLNGNVILAGQEVTYTINVIGENYTIDTSKISIKSGDKVSSSGEPVSSGGTGGASISEPEINTSNNKTTITIQTYNDIKKVGYIILNINTGFVTTINGIDSEATTITYYVATLNGTSKVNNDGKIDLTATVGVHNSFYIKEYKFENIDTVEGESRTTNEYTYKGLSNKTHKVSVKITFYIDKNNQTYEKSGTISQDISVSTSEGNLEIHYIDATNGTAEADAIFVRMPCNDGSYKTMLIDTGRTGEESVVNDIDKYLKSNGLVSTEADNNGLNVVKIDYLVITHFDVDHYGGFEGLTGIKYDTKNDKGYTQNRSGNEINGEQMYYYFRNIVLGCNYQEFNDTNGKAAIVNYAENNTSINFIKITAGNSLKIGDAVINIFNPYPKENVPIEWLGDYYKGDEFFRDKDWYCPQENTQRTDKAYNVDENAKGGIRLAQTSVNNSSIVMKLIYGGNKTLLTGDALYYAEELMTGTVADEIANKTNGLRIDEPRDRGTSEDTPISNYISLVKELKNEEGKTLEQLENEYKLSRFTCKDLSAQILKKGHHSLYNSTSIKFLENVHPDKIVATSRTNNTAGDNPYYCLQLRVAYRIVKYYSDTCNISTINKDNWKDWEDWENYIYSVKPKSTIYDSKYVYGTLFKTDGKTWIHENIASKK